MGRAIIIIPACRLSQGRVSRFFEYNAGTLRDAVVSLVGMPDDEYELPQGVGFVRYPHSMRCFSLSRVVNYALRAMVDGPPDTLVIKTDIDASLVDGRVIRLGEGFDANLPPQVHVRSSQLADYEETAKANKIKGHSTVVARAHVWRSLCGYNERLYGWGWEDIDLKLRLLRRFTVSKEGLVYLLPNEPQTRKWYPDRNRVNKHLAQIAEWQEANWGLASYDDFDEYVWAKEQAARGNELARKYIERYGA